MLVPLVFCRLLVPLLTRSVRTTGHRLLTLTDPISPPIGAFLIMLDTQGVRLVPLCKADDHLFPDANFIVANTLLRRVIDSASPLFRSPTLPLTLQI